MPSPGLRRGLVAVAGLLLTGVAVVVLVLLSPGSSHHHRQAVEAVHTAPPPRLDIRHKLAFFTVLSTSPGASVPGNGRVVALSMKTGKVAWSHALPPGSESSPLVHGLSVFLGDQGGTVYSYRTYDGHLNWTFHASGGVKGGVAFAHNTIYFGDYGGHV